MHDIKYCASKAILTELGKGCPSILLDIRRLKGLAKHRVNGEFENNSIFRQTKISCVLADAWHQGVDLCKTPGLIVNAESFAHLSKGFETYPCRFDTFNRR